MIINIHYRVRTSMKTSTKKPRIWDAVKSPIRKGDNTALKKVLVKFKEEGKWSEVRTGNVLSWIRKESLIRAGKGEQNLIHPELKNDLKKLNDLSRQEQCDKTKQILKEIDAHLKTGDYLFLQAVIRENKRDDGGRLVFPASKLRKAASVIKLLSPAFEGKTSDIVDLKKAGKERVQVLTQSFQDSPRIYNADAVALNAIYNVLAPAAKRYRENGKTISCEEILAQKGIAETKDSYWNLGIALLLVSGRRTCEIFGGNATFTPLSENPYALTFTGQAKTKTTTPLSYTILTTSPCPPTSLLSARKVFLREGGVEGGERHFKKNTVGAALLEPAASPSVSLSPTPIFHHQAERALSTAAACYTHDH